jgi:Domain of unknown function (DUF4352)
VVAVLAVFFIIGKIGYNIGSTSRSSSTTTLGAMPPPPRGGGGSAPSATTSAPMRLAGIGQEVRDGNFGFVVTSVDVSKTAGDPSNQFITAQGEFVNVHLTVSNLGDRSQSFFASNQTLQIGANQFSSNNAATMWTQSMTAEINPGNSIQAVVSFDVPPGTSNDGVLTVHESPFSGGAKISLRQPRQ